MEEKIIVRNAIKRKKHWLYWIDKKGNLCGVIMPKKYRSKR
jgi:hypothetical protein